MYQYEQLRIRASAKTVNIFPLYHDVLGPKKKCYPDTIDINEIAGAEVGLQNLLDHATERLVQSFENLKNNFRK